MKMTKLAVIALAVAVTGGGVGLAISDWVRPDPAQAIELQDDARRDNALADVSLVDDDDDDRGDGDSTRGNDGTNGGDNTGGGGGSWSGGGSGSWSGGGSSG